MGDLGINLPTLIAQLVNFIILLVILRLFVYKPLVGMLDNRANRIRESVSLAEKTREEAAKAEQEMRAQMDAARQEGQKVLAQASKLGEQVKEEARGEAKREAEVLMAKAKADAEREREKTLDELRKQFSDIAVLAAEKVIDKTLDKKAHERLIEETLEASPLLKKN